MGEFLIFSKLLLVFFGFVALSFVSSSGYIINDLVNISLDRHHPEKRTRPLAAGTLTTSTAYLLLPPLLILGFGLSLYTGFQFLVLAITLFLSSLLYTFFLSKIPFVDVHVIAFNYIIRGLSGVVIVGAPFSPWFIITLFFFALFLSFGKRQADLLYLGSLATNHKPVFGTYTLPLLRSSVLISFTALLLSYTMYTFTSGNITPGMVITVPIVSFALFRYYYLIESQNPVARRTELLFKDVQILLSLLVWISITGLFLYTPLF